MALPELPDDRRAQPRRYGPADQPASPRRQQGPIPPGVAAPLRAAAERPRRVDTPQGTPAVNGGRPGGPLPQVGPRNGQQAPVPPAVPGRSGAGAGPAGPVRGRPASNSAGQNGAGPNGRPAVARLPDPGDDEPTEVQERVTDDPPEPGVSPEAPGRHRRRAGASPNSRPASEYREQVESGGRKVRPGRRRRPTFWKELPLLIVVALLLTFLIQTFLAKVYVIPSGSMETTLHGCTGCNNDRVLVDKMTYRFSDPQPGDVVVFRGPDSWSSEVTFEPPSNALLQVLQQFGGLIGLAPPDEKDFVKRVIAVGGQTVQCCDSRNRVLVDGQPLDEPYVYYLPEAGPARTTGFGPVTIPEGQLWMMGDSRNNSADSRVPGHGPVPAANVIGKARLIVLPFPRFGWIESVDPQTTAVGMAPAATDDAVPLGLGLVGVLPLVALRRRIDRRDREILAFLPGRR